MTFMRGFLLFCGMWGVTVANEHLPRIGDHSMWHAPLFAVYGLVMCVLFAASADKNNA